MAHPDLTVSNFMENSIGLKRVKKRTFLPTEAQGSYVTVHWRYRVTENLLRS